MVGSRSLTPMVAKIEERKSQGAKGKAVVSYCDPLATTDLAASGYCNSSAREYVSLAVSCHGA